MFGKLLCDRRQYQEAFSYFERAAKQGHTDSQFEVWNMHCRNLVSNINLSIPKTVETNLVRQWHGQYLLYQACECIKIYSSQSDINFTWETVIHTLLASFKRVHGDNSDDFKALCMYITMSDKYSSASTWHDLKYPIEGFPDLVLDPEILALVSPAVDEYERALKNKNTILQAAQATLTPTAQGGYQTFFLPMPTNPPGSLRGDTQDLHLVKKAKTETHNAFPQNNAMTL